MPRNQLMAEQILQRLREADESLSQYKTVAHASNAISNTEQMK